MDRIKSFVIAFLLLSLFSGCDKDDPAEEPDVLAHKMNEFIHEAMHSVYLWNDKLPELSPESESDPKEYFKKHLYDMDKWSYITDDAEGFMAEMNGNMETFGYDLGYSEFEDSDRCLAIVLYVHPESPAAGKLKRGDLIIRMNSKEFTKEDMGKFSEAGTIRLELGRIEGNTVYPTGNQVTLQSKRMDVDPVLVKRLFERGNHKIGYMLYTNFITKYNSSVSTLFRDFKRQGITDLILDLRYNSGGENTAAKYLCSAIAPKDKAVKGQVLSKEVWNTQCQKAFESTPNGKDMLYEYFVDVDCNLDLPTKRVFILTGGGCASASEYTIVCLKSFMDVTLVGTETYGKFYTMSVFSPLREENGKMVTDKELDNWLIAPVCSRFTNIDDYPASTIRLQPDYKVADDPFNGIELGSEDEPLLAKALELITGTKRMQPRAASLREEPPFKMIEMPLDDVKSNLIIYK